MRSRAMNNVLPVLCVIHLVANSRTITCAPNHDSGVIELRTKFGGPIMNILNFKRIMSGLICLCLTSISLYGHANSRDEWNQPRHRETQYHGSQHIYYPKYRAYFAPHSKTWFWLEGSYWRSSYRRPHGINVQIGGIPILLRHSEPYYEHRYIEARHPRPNYVIREYRHPHHRRHHQGRHEYQAW